MAETETNKVWIVDHDGDDWYLVRTGVAPRAETLWDQLFLDRAADYLNALEACIADLPAVLELAEWYAGEHEFGTEQSAPLARTAAALARLRELREGNNG